MWAKAQIANEIITLLSTQEPIIIDTQKRIAQMELKNVKTTSNS